jgi:thymidylate synthase (FAD)
VTNIINVLDHGSVRLVEHMGSDLSIVRNARVSYDAEWRSGEDEGKDAKLIDYLVKHSHTSPLEAVNFTFDVRAPIFVARQWMRHRTFSLNEISARYSELPAVFYTPWVDQITTQSPTNKQMRTKEQHPQALYFQDLMRKTCEDAFTAYKEMIDAGVPRELARGVLPMNTYTHFFCTVDLHNLMKFCKLRLHAHAQHEIQVYAQAMLDLAKQVAPITIAAVERHWIA